MNNFYYFSFSGGGERRRSPRQKKKQGRAYWEIEKGWGVPRRGGRGGHTRVGRVSAGGGQILRGEIPTRRNSSGLSTGGSSREAVPKQQYSDAQRPNCFG